jgi:tetratricopeptide (TPR) repeat protein
VPRSAATRIRHDLPVILFLVIATALVYGQVWDFDFIHYDDPHYVRDNVIVQNGLTWQGVRWAFTTTAMANWHPLTWLSYMLDCQLFGPSPGAHHLVNVLFHGINSILLFLILQRMTGARWRSAFVAALFAFHPLHVESVAWIAERKDVLSTIFLLLSMGAYVLYSERRDLKRYLLVLFFFSLGLMAKSMLVTLPVILLLMDYWPLKRFSVAQPQMPARPDPIEESKGKRRRRGRTEQKRQPQEAKEKDQTRPFLLMAAEKIPFFVLSAVIGMIAIYTQQRGGAVVSFTQLPIAERIGNAIVSYTLYLWKMIWPSGLAVFYPFPSWSSLEILASAALLTAISAGVLRGRRRFPYLMFGWLWYLLTLLPVIGLIKLGDAGMADRYSYITLIGPFIALAWGARDLAERLSLPRFTLPAVAGVVLGACMIVTYVQLGHWRDSFTLFTHALKVTEKNFLAHSSLANAFVDAGRIEEGLSHFDRAIEIAPRLMVAHYNRGIAMNKLGRTEEAMMSFRRALEVDPGYPDANVELASLYLQRGDADGAILHFGRAIRTTEPKPKAYAGLAEAYILKGRPDEALSYSLQALEGQPANAKLHYNIASIYIHKGRIDEAIRHFQEAVRLSPDYAKAHNNLGSALMLKGRLDEAIPHFREAVRIDPDYKMARENLIDAQARQKKTSGR